MVLASVIPKYSCLIVGQLVGIQASDPNSEQGRSYHDRRVDWSDPTVVLDERDAKASRIVFQGKGEDQSPTPEALALSAVVSSIEHGRGPISECF